MAVGSLRRAPVRHRRHGVAAGSFWLLEVLPVNFAYLQFALIPLLNGIGMGLFASPNRAVIMNSLPTGQEEAAALLAAFRDRYGA